MGITLARRIQETAPANRMLLSPSATRYIGPGLRQVRQVLLQDTPALVQMGLYGLLELVPVGVVAMRGIAQRLQLAFLGMRISRPQSPCALWRGKPIRRCGTTPRTGERMTGGTACDRSPDYFMSVQGVGDCERPRAYCSDVHSLLNR